MILALVAWVHLYIYKKYQRPTHTHNITQQRGKGLYVSKRAMLTKQHWHVAQHLYATLSRRIFLTFACVSIPLICLDAILIFTYQNGWLLIGEIVCYIVTLLAIHVVIETKLKHI